MRHLIKLAKRCAQDVIRRKEPMLKKNCFETVKGTSPFEEEDLRLEHLGKLVSGIEE